MRGDQKQPVVAIEGAEHWVVKEMVSRIVIDGPNIFHLRLAATFKGFGQLNFIGPAAGGTQEFGGLCLVAAVLHFLKDQLILALHQFVLLGSGRRLHDLGLHQTKPRRL